MNNSSCSLNLTLERCQEICQESSILICECLDQQIRIECQPVKSEFHQTLEFQIGIFIGTIILCCVIILSMYFHYKKKYQIKIRDYRLKEIEISCPTQSINSSQMRNLEMRSSKRISQNKLNHQVHDYIPELDDEISSQQTNDHTPRTSQTLRTSQTICTSQTPRASHTTRTSNTPHISRTLPTQYAKMPFHPPDERQERNQSGCYSNNELDW